MMVGASLPVRRTSEIGFLDNVLNTLANHLIARGKSVDIKAGNFIYYRNGTDSFFFPSMYTMPWAVKISMFFKGQLVFIRTQIDIINFVVAFLAQEVFFGIASMLILASDQIWPIFLLPIVLFCIAVPFVIFWLTIRLWFVARGCHHFTNLPSPVASAEM